MPLFRVLLADLIRFGGRRLVLGIILAAIGAGFEGAGIMLLLPLLAAAGVSGGAATPLANLATGLGLPALLILWVAVVAGQSLFTARREVALSRLNQDFILHLRRRLHQAVLSMEWVAFQTLRSSHVVSTLSSTATRVGQGLHNLVQFGASLLLVIAHSIIVLIVSPGATLLALAMGGVLVVAQVARLRGMFRHGTNIGNDIRQVHTELSDHLAAMKMAKSLNAERPLAAAFERQARRLGDSLVKSTGEWTRGRTRQKLAGAVLLAVTVWVAVGQFAIEGAQLLVLVAVFARLLPAISLMIQSAFRVAETLPAYAEMEEMRNHCEAHAEPLPPLNAAAPAGSLRLSGIGFTWPGRNHPALDRIEMEIAENRTTALVGPSGAGKSTLADICLGLLTPDTGTIRIGDHLLCGPMRSAWRTQTALVPQDIFLFHDSVANNLRWANPAATENDLWQALDAAAAAELVKSLPQGLETVVGDRGVRLSGGERQRLALARALLRKPAFLVLDEATSHLDVGHERHIQDSLGRLHGKLTVLVIAHRLSTVRHADSIVVIENGRIAETGNWEQLTKRQGWFAGATAQG